MAGTPWSDTSVEARGDGRYLANISSAWMLAMVPQGGVVAALAVRAMEAELGSTTTGQQLRTINGLFVSPVPAGPVEIDVVVLRRGRSMSHAQATVRAPGAAAGFTATAAFGGRRPGPSFTELEMPSVPRAEDCPSFRDPPPPGVVWDEWEPMPFWVHVLEGRPALGTPPWDSSPRSNAEVATWYRMEDEPVDPDGRLDPLTSLVMVDVMPSAVFERIGPGQDRWFAPSVDLTVHTFGSATPGWLLAHNTAHVAGHGYASVQMALWDPRGEEGPDLIAYATQIAFFTALD